jgi:GNAT superfamily N-acetyltransferase
MAGDDVLFSIRRARLEDAPVIAWHRARMFQDVGTLPIATFEDLMNESRLWTERALASGEYVGWLATPKSDLSAIVGGAGVQMRQVPPHPFRPPRGDAFAKGKHAIVLNVFTNPEWRRRGLARLLMEEILRWARAEQLDRLVLHASSDAKPLYEQLGFEVTNEMRIEVGEEVRRA